MAGHTGIWNCHPDLQSEWNSFAEECRQTANSNLNSDLWMNFWRYEQPHSSTTENSDQNDAKSEPDKAEVGNDIVMSPSASEKELVHSQVGDLSLSDSQLKQLHSVSHELADIFEMDGGEILDELREEISSLPNHGLPLLLKELRSQLSDEGAYKMCAMFCEERDREPVVNVAILFQYFILPMLSGDGHEQIGAGMESGIIQLSESFPSECVSHLLKPLLVSKLTVPLKSELVSRMLPSLPEKDFVSFIQHFALQCSSPMEEWQIQVLNAMMTESRVNFLETLTESPLVDLLPSLSSSARVLASSESFASVLLKVIAALKQNRSTRVYNELATIVQQNSTFNKQALMNALKNMGS